MKNLTTYNQEQENYGRARRAVMDTEGIVMPCEPRREEPHFGEVTYDEDRESEEDLHYGVSWWL